MNSRSVSNWCSPKTLAALIEVNELCIDVLCEAAAATVSKPCISPVEQLRDTLRSLDAATRRRAAHCPLLLVDVQFRNVEWWQRVRSHPGHGRVSEALPSLPRKRGTQLIRAALVLAWHTARFEREAASLVIGMSPPVVDLVAAHSLKEIDHLCQLHAYSVRPRWSDRVLAWRSLLVAARHANATSIRDVHIHALQLAGGEALRHSV